jgi:signal transduction histidine kinase
MKILTAVKPGRLVFPLACLAALAMLFVSEGSYWQAVGTLDKLGVMGGTSSAINNLQSSILDAEAGQRGYLLTGRAEYLQPYGQAVVQIDRSLNALDEFYQDNPKSVASLHKLREISATKLSELALTIQLQQQGRVEASREIVLSNIGREKMDAIRLLGDELLAAEAAQVALSRTDIYRTLLISRMGMATLCAVGLLGIFFYLRQNAALKKREHDLQDIVQAKHDRLEVEVVQRTAQLTELTHHLLTAREDERNRLARNLHDDLGALLTSAKLDAARIKSRLAAKVPEALVLLAHLVDTLNSSIALGRRIIEDLRPSALSNLGLVATLEILAREFEEHSSVQVHCALAPVNLPASAELMVYRLVQEAITNITKYANAKNVWLTLSSQQGQVEVSVRDDGVGFDPGVASRSVYGLVGMRFRVEAEGGHLTVMSAKGQGVHLQARLPAGLTPSRDLAAELQLL